MKKAQYKETKDRNVSNNSRAQTGRKTHARVPRYTTKMPKSPMRYMLEALIPYAGANLRLVFKPSAFFYELERLDRAREYARSTLKNSYYQAKKYGWIELNDLGTPRITAEGVDALEPHVPSLVRNSCVMVVFDIPETERWKRRYIRSLLRELKFVKIQQSVWTSQLDCRQILAKELHQLALTKKVLVYEAAQVDLSS